MKLSSTEFKNLVDNKIKFIMESAENPDIVSIELKEATPNVIGRKYLIPGNAVKYDKSGVNDTDAEAYLYTQSTKNLPAAIGFKGKSNKPIFRFYFKDEKQRTDYLDKFFEDVKKHLNDKIEKSERRKNLENPYKIGDILYSSWGYDQTNVDFFQVIEVKDKTITLQEIEHESVGPEGMMSTYVMPIKDKFIAKSVPFKKIVTNPTYITLGHSQSARRWDGTKKYASWYA